MGDSQLIDGKYRLGEALSSTDRVVVHIARHMRIQRDVSIKLLAPDCPAEGPDAALLVREGRIAGGVTHRNVQSVVDSGIDADGRPFIVYEALTGKTLAEIIAENPSGVGVERAARLTNQLVDALSTVHDGGVVHRAVGPEAVTVVPIRGGEELLKLGNFQDAVYARDVEREPLTMGASKPYVPNELRTGGVFDAKADLYSAGCIFRALLTGSPHGKLARLPDTVRRAVAQATAELPEERFPEADLFLHVLAIILGHRPGRDDEAVPDDALAADLGFLKLRRPTRMSYHDGDAPAAEPGAIGQPRVELLVVLLIIEAIYRELGARWGELVAQIPEVEGLLPGSGNTELNQTRGIDVELVGRILEAVDQIAGNDDLGLVARLGERVAERGFSRLAPAIAAARDADAVIQLFPELWKTITRQGEARVMEATAGAARLAVQHQVFPSLELTALAAGIVKGVLALAGAEHPRVQTPTSEALGDEATVFRVRWDPW